MVFGCQNQYLLWYSFFVIKYDVVYCKKCKGLLENILYLDGFFVMMRSHSEIDLTFLRVCRGQHQYVVYRTNNNICAFSAIEERASCRG